MDLVPMATGVNPLIPAAWELTMLLVFGAVCAALLVAVITLVCDRYYTRAR